jgi:hypothetical protein
MRRLLAEMLGLKEDQVMQMTNQLLETPEPHGNGTTRLTRL